MMLHCSARLGIIAYFYSNQTYIAEVLCINKEKPAMHCEGKCFLSQKLKVHDEKEKQAPHALKVVEEAVYFLEDNLLNCRSALTDYTIQLVYYFVLTPYPSPLHIIETPPKI
jgi:hypothetical protein